MSDADLLQPLDTGLLSHRAKERLQNAIIDGLFGDRLPSEVELARQLGVSRPTVRSALRSLEEDGLITRRRGIGTKINGHIVRAKLTLNRAVGFYDLIKEAGHEPAIAFTRIRPETASLEAATRLQCQPGADLISIDRLFLADGAPAISLVETIGKANLTVDAISDSDVSESIFTFADAYAVKHIDHTVVEIIPAIADRRLAKLLEVKGGDPLLHLLETHYSVENDLMMVSDIYVVDRFVRFCVVRRRT
jgi:GntR family transcriptional regulator